MRAWKIFLILLLATSPSYAFSDLNNDGEINVLDYAKAFYRIHQNQEEQNFGGLAILTPNQDKAQIVNTNPNSVDIEVAWRPISGEHQALVDLRSARDGSRIANSKRAVHNQPVTLTIPRQHTDYDVLVNVQSFGSNGRWIRGSGRLIAMLRVPAIASQPTTTSPGTALSVSRQLVLDDGTRVQGIVRKLTGTVGVDIADDFTNHASEEFHTITDSGGNTYDIEYTSSPPRVISGSRMELQGIWQNNKFNVESSTITPTSTDSGYRVTYSATPRGVGNRKIIVLMAKSSASALQPKYTKAYIQNLVFGPAPSVKSFFEEVSYGKQTISGDVYGWLTIPSSVFQSCNTANWKRQANNVAKSQGINVGSYDARLYIFEAHEKNKFADCERNVGGKARLGGDWAYVYDSNLGSHKTIAHEIGHNFGLHHANGENCDPHQAPGGGSSCHTVEYANYYDVMGAGTYALNMPHLLELNWLTNANIQSVTSNGIYTIESLHTQTNGIKALKVGPYYVNYPGISIHDTGNHYNSYSGVSIERGSSKTQLFDANPGTGSGLRLQHSDHRDSALSDGQSFYDLSRDIIIRQVSHDNAHATVEVLFQKARCKQAPPSVKLTPDIHTNSGSTRAFYSVDVTNNDPTFCQPNTYDLQSTSDSTIQISQGTNGVPEQVTVAPGTTHGTFVIANSNQAGRHKVEVTATDVSASSLRGSGSATLEKTGLAQPTITLSSPRNNEVVRCTQNLEASSIVPPGTGIGSIHYFIREITSPSGMRFYGGWRAPYRYRWASTRHPNARYEIYAEAYDWGGKRIESPKIQFDVSNTPDRTRPTITINSPRNGATVSGRVSIVASARDDCHVNSIEFYVDGRLKRSIQNPAPGSHTYTWDTTKETAGSHKIKVLVQDSGFNSQQRTITVDVPCQGSGCGRPPPPPPASCGNGLRETGESCDFGSANGPCPAVCSTSCKTNSCSGGGGPGGLV